MQIKCVLSFPTRFHLLECERDKEHAHDSNHALLTVRKKMKKSPVLLAFFYAQIQVPFKRLCWVILHKKCLLKGNRNYQHKLGKTRVIFYTLNGSMQQLHTDLIEIRYSQVFISSRAIKFQDV